MIIFDKLLPLPASQSTLIKAGSSTTTITYSLISGLNPINMNTGNFLTMKFRHTSIDTNGGFDSTEYWMTIMGGSPPTIFNNVDIGYERYINVLDFGNNNGFGSDAESVFGKSTYTINDTGDLVICPMFEPEYDTNIKHEFLYIRYWGVA